MSDLPSVFNVAEFAAWARCTETSIYKAMKAGRLPFMRYVPGAGYRGTRDALDRWLKEQEQSQSDPFEPPRLGAQKMTGTPSGSVLDLAAELDEQAEREAASKGLSRDSGFIVFRKSPEFCEVEHVHRVPSESVAAFLERHSDRLQEGRGLAFFTADGELARIAQ